MCAQRRLRSAWTSSQSDQSLRCPHEESLGLKLPSDRTSKTLIRLGRCPGWSESSLGAYPLCWFCYEAAQMSLKVICHSTLFQKVNLNLNSVFDYIQCTCKLTFGLVMFWPCLHIYPDVFLMSLLVDWCLHDVKTLNRILLLHCISWICKLNVQGFRLTWNQIFYCRYIL